MHPGFFWPLFHRTHFSSLFAYLLDLFSGLFGCNSNVVIKNFYTLVPADLHDEFQRGAGQEFVGAERKKDYKL
jgi:hypothetical protein